MLDFSKFFACTAADLQRGLFFRDLSQAGRVNRQVLGEILFRNRNTEFGRCHFFSLLRSSKLYKDLVPVSRYAEYLPLIQRMAGGERNVLVSDSLYGFTLTSGTTGTPKRIPVTGRSLSLFHRHLLVQGLLHQSIPTCRRLGPGLTLLGGVLGRPEGKHPAFFGKASSEITGLTRPETLYLQLLLALMEPDLMYLNAPFSSDILEFSRGLELLGESLALALEQGTLPRELKLDPLVRASYEQNLRLHPERARLVRESLALGTEAIVSRLWPQMLFIACVSGGSFALYTNKLRHYLGHIPIHSAAYTSMEALIGLSLVPESQVYAITPRSAYYEFIPQAEQHRPHPSLLDLDELSIGACYEVVVTNVAGLYRYRLGDVVRVVGYQGQSPLVEYCYRADQVLNLAGEKTSEQVMLGALLALDLPLVDYTVVLNQVAPCYEVLVETEDLSPSLALSEKLEEALGRGNPRYAELRQQGKLAPVKLLFLRSGAFENLKACLLAQGRSGERLIVPRLLKDEALIGTLRNSL